MPVETADALAMDDIGKSFGSVHALRGVSLTVRRGEIHALLGENGAGKSTLMRILDGVYPAGSYRGTVAIAGRQVALSSPHDARRAGIGYVPQEITVIDHLSVAENIFVGDLGWNWHIPRRLHARAVEFLAANRIDLDAAETVARLGPGQRHLLMIARALAANPTVLILDEPTASLVGDEVGNLFRLIRHLVAGGGCCIYISHRLHEVVELADRATVLRDGKVAARFDRGFTEDLLVEAMLGHRPQAVAAPATGVVGDEALRVERLTVPNPHRPERPLVEDLSFSVHRGEILGLAGLPGSGCCEAVDALYGRLPHTGAVAVAGHPVRLDDPRAARQAGLGLVTAERRRDGLLPNLSVAANISLACLPSVTRRGWMDRGREDALAAGYREQLSIRVPSLAASVLTLSGGNQQKVVLARALAAQPGVLFLNEPTRGVDIGAREEIHALLGVLASRGLALVVVSTDLPELLRLCHRFLVLVDGRMADAFPRAEASEARILRAAAARRMAPA
ncbi:xylose import ATP-binding protein XylG [Planctomycetota bacterium]|nr:xylose import ATP-binding protein XylG [Planctomycetota bacterium]